MPKIKSVQFVDAVTVANRPSGGLQASEAMTITEDAAGVLVGNPPLCRVPWANVKFITYEAPPAGKKP